jgi:L-aspartate oxidase
LADLTVAEPADLLIIGGGIAGMCAALCAPQDARIIVLDKGEAGAGSSPLAQGGMAAAVTKEDSAQLHADDTIRAGAQLCDEDVVRDFCEQGPDAVSWLIEQGCLFDRDATGALDAAREGGQSVARSVHRADATGAEIVRALREALRNRRVQRVRARAEQLLFQDGACVGAATAEASFPAAMTLLATGGGGGLWGRTTNQPGATADGAALAAIASVALSDLEFMQFHPTALASAEFGQRVLLTEALRGDGAFLVNEQGERFVDELAPRHVVANAILSQKKAFLDARMIGKLEERFPTVVAAVRQNGFDPVTEPIPVEPAAHYFIGGVASDAYGRTSVQGLFAAGEAASTGFHGANRMAGNSLTEAVVMGRRVGRFVQSNTKVPLLQTFDNDRRVTSMPAELPEILWGGAGPVRSAEQLAAGLQKVEQLQSQAWNAHLLLATSILELAITRTETRGVHVRADHPETDPAFAKRSQITLL